MYKFARERKEKLMLQLKMGKELKRIPHKYGHIYVGNVLTTFLSSVPNSVFSFFPILIAEKNAHSGTCRGYGRRVRVVATCEGRLVRVVNTQLLKLRISKT